MAHKINVPEKIRDGQVEVGLEPLPEWATVDEILTAYAATVCKVADLNNGAEAGDTLRVPPRLMSVATSLVAGARGIDPAIRNAAFSRAMNAAVEAGYNAMTLRSISEAIARSTPYRAALDERTHGDA